MNMQMKFAEPRSEPFRFTVDQFIALADQGLFDAYAKSELIEGEIVCMNAQWSPHARIKTNLCVELAFALRALGFQLKPQVEVSVRLDDNSLPEPDIILTDYRGKGAVPVAEVALIVEVSDTTLEIDLGRKLRIYAEAKVPEYWVIDLNGGQAIRNWEPSGGSYARRDETPLGERMESATIGGLAVVTER